MTSIGSTLDRRLRSVMNDVTAATERSGRSPGSVVVVAVSKTASREAVDEAYASGLRCFGENRVGDALAKFRDAPLPADATLHMIGQLQSNKATKAVALFDVIESVDRPSLVNELERIGAKLGRNLPILLQVNVAGETQKAGCSPDEIGPLLDAIADSPHLVLRGLMTIGPLTDDPESVRPVFRALRVIRDRVREARGWELPDLSMGMTNDFPVAIEEGATHVRIGRAIFGP
jgi:pyridoxal phosphate enzyme (YggS family)